MPLEDVEVTQLPPERFAEVLTPGALAAFEHSIARGRELLGSRTIWNVNSTALRRRRRRDAALADRLRPRRRHRRPLGGHRGRRRVLPHHQAPAQPPARRRRATAGRWATRSAAPTSAAAPPTPRRSCEMLRPGDVVILHDPQTAGHAPALRAATDVPVIWRAHIGLDLPNDLAREAWQLPHALRRGGRRVRVLARGVHLGGARPRPGSASSRRRSTRSRRRTTRWRSPAIDRGAARRRPGRRPPPAASRGLRAPRRQRRLRRARARRWSRRTRCASTRPLLAQVSRWDRLKDPLGVLAAFAEHVHAGRGAAPRARGPGRRRGRRRPGGRRGASPRPRPPGTTLPPDVRRRVHLALLPMDDADENAVIVNALQRRADVVAQKSLAEGFGLTVAEAMWKGRPVVATRRRRHPGPDRGRPHRAASSSRATSPPSASG